MRSLGEGMSTEELLYILQNLTHCIKLMKGAMLTRAPLEMTLLKLTKRGTILDIGSLAERLEKLCEGEGFSPGESTGVSRETRIPEKEEKKTEIGIPPAAGEDYSSDPAHWNAVLSYVKNKKMSVFTFLNSARPVEFNRNKVVIGFGKGSSFNKEVLETGSNREVIEEAVNCLTGATPRVEFVLLDFLDKPDAKKAMDAEKKSVSREKMKPVIEKVMDVFGGNVIRDVMEDHS
jgi:hypothetical protein